MTAFLSVSDVSMAFPVKGNGRFLALDRISMDVAKNEFVCLIGHSGCGKSTLLNLIAGLLLPSSGTITCEQKPVRGPGPDRAMVFQSHALLPWMTCYENVHLAVKQVFGRTLERRELKDKAEQVRIVESIRSTVVMVTHDIDEAILLSDRILMMTNGPAARIGDVLEVALPRPRQRLVLATSPQYAAYRQHLLKFLYQKQGVALE